MKRSDFAIKLAMAALFVAVAIYFGIAVFKSTSSLRTERAAVATVERTVSADGWAVRDETVIKGGGRFVLSAEDGERIRAGGQVALQYTSDGDLEAASTLQALEVRRSQLMSIIAGFSVDPLRLVTDVSKAVRTDDMTALTELGVKVDAAIHGTVTAEEAAQELSRVESDIAVIESHITSARSVCSDRSGIFTSAVDGFESVTPEDVRGVGVSALTSMFGSASPDKDAVGKIITGTTWYFASVMEPDAVNELRNAVTDPDTGEIDPDKRITVEFTGAYRATLDMTVMEISEPEDGNCVVLFACRSGLSDACSQRKLTAEVVFSSVSGIRVSSSALCHDEEGDFVYIITGLQAEKLYVTVLNEYDGYAYLEDQTPSGGRLREGCEIITDTEGITDGKVVRG